MFGDLESRMGRSGGKGNVQRATCNVQHGIDKVDCHYSCHVEAERIGVLGTLNAAASLPSAAEKRARSHR